MIPYINVPFEYLSYSTGASVDELKLITSFLLSYPFAGLLKRVPDDKPHLKNYFIIAVSLFYLVGLFDLWAGIATLAFSSISTYAIAKSIDSPYMPWIGFVFLMGHMSISHIYRQLLNDPTVVDVTGAQMVLVMKLSAFCWNVQDGRQQEKDLADFQRERALRQIPSVLDFAGYVLFFPSLMAGPAFDFIEYKRWLETSMFDLPPGVDPSKAPKTRKSRRIPRSGTPAAIKAAKGLGWIFLFLQLNNYFHHDVVLDDNFLQYNILRRMMTIHMVNFTTRLKYYGVWTMTEGACILTGLGYNGINPKTGRVDWDRLQNVRPFGVELAQNSRAYLENWNMNTNHWLRNYVYLRVTPKGKKPGFRASLATFTTSAFWHGFYPGYYLTFVLASFIQTAAKNVRRYVRPLYLSADGKHALRSKRYYDFATYLTTQTIFSFTTLPFILLTIPDSILVWRRVYFYAIVEVALGIAFFASPAKAWLIRTQKARVKKHEERVSAARAAIEAEKRPPINREKSHSKGGMLGLPDDPVKDIDEIVNEVMGEMERQRKLDTIQEGKTS